MMLFNLSPGAIVKHRYVVSKKLGEGENSITYSVTDRDDNQTKAMKVVKSDRAGLFGWRTEVDGLTKVRGMMGIPTLYDWFNDSSNSVIVTSEYLMDLEQLKENNPLKEMGLGLKNVLSIGNHSLTLIQMIHSQNLIHRNIRLSNIMLRKNHMETRYPIALVNFSFALNLNMRASSSGLKDPLFVRSIRCTPNMHNGNIATKRDDIWMWIYALVELIEGDVFGLKGNENQATVMAKKTEFEKEPYKYTDEAWVHEIVKKINSTKSGEEEKYNKFRSILMRAKRGFDLKSYKIEGGFTVDDKPYLF